MTPLLALVGLAAGLGLLAIVAWRLVRARSSRVAVRAPFALPVDAQRLALTLTSGLEHAPACRYGQTTLALAADGSLGLEMRRGGQRACWEGRVTPAARARLLGALREAGFPAPRPPKGPAPAIRPGQTFDTLVVVGAGDDGASGSLTMDANELRFDAVYGPAWALLACLTKQVSAGEVGYGDAALLPDAVEAARRTA